MHLRLIIIVAKRLWIVILSPLKNVDRDPIGSRTGTSFERKFSLLMHVDACKAPEIGGKKVV